MPKIEEVKPVAPIEEKVEITPTPIEEETTTTTNDWTMPDVSEDKKEEEKVEDKKVETNESSKYSYMDADEDDDLMNIEF